MQLLDRTDIKPLLTFVKEMKKDISAWQLLDISLLEYAEHNIMYIARQVERTFSDREGLLFIHDNKHLFGFVKRIDDEENFTKTAQQVEKRLPKDSCAVISEKVTADGMKRVDIRISKNVEAVRDGLTESSLLALRVDRPSNVIMIVDDCDITLSIATKAASFFGKAIDISNSELAVDGYLKHVPDVVFLDINMPEKSGLDILPEIYKYDKNAYIVMLSGSGTHKNVLTIKKHGVRGFITKPFKTEQLLAAIKKCGTIRPVKSH